MLEKISVVVPLYNEAENLPLLYEKLTAVLADLTTEYEIIFVDDGSTDNSLEVLQAIHDRDEAHVCIIEFRRNFGKTAALAAGFRSASGNIIATLDADLQDDPNELPGMIAELGRGYDLVVAWRKQRMDSSGKRRSSRFFNWVTSQLVGGKFHDLNSGFKVYRREVIETIRLYSDLHRYIPILAEAHGFRAVEKVVAHHPRYAGESKYGYGRIARGLMDLLMVLFVTRYLRHPLRLFGWMGITIFMGGMTANLYLGILWFVRMLGLADIPPIGTRPLLAVAILATLLGIQFISIGLLGEMIRYFNYQPQQEYSIRRIWH